ncbi:hypothetical protein CPC08DRAFT_428873 [Agrocybe pediades]|nr:hypothetical protein CPC08DRAFT_428873 [Agrocybe pediades]
MPTHPHLFPSLFHVNPSSPPSHHPVRGGGAVLTAAIVGFATGHSSSPQSCLQQQRVGLYPTQISDDRVWHRMAVICEEKGET